MYTVWYSTESLADFLIDHTSLFRHTHRKAKLYESDASKPNSFHTLPDHIKKILYLDSPDLIVEKEGEPLFSLEVSSEAGTGHNAFQRFARLAASVESGVPALYVYPEAVIIKRKVGGDKWDSLNPLIFKALEDVMVIYDIPALLFYFPSDYGTHPASASPNRRHKGLRLEGRRKYAGCPDAASSEMTGLFQAIDKILSLINAQGIMDGRRALLRARDIRNVRTWMQGQFTSKGGSSNASPLTSTITVPTSALLKYLGRYEKGGYRIGDLLRSREETVIYKVDATFRGDPYPGALAAIDYLECRTGRTFEDREKNLVLAWGDVTHDAAKEVIQISGTKGDIDDFVRAVMASENKNLLTKSFDELRPSDIPRYYMQVRYGSTYSKVKHIRVFSYFADAILFPNGGLWRDG